MNVGSAIFILCHPNMFSNSCVRSRFAWVKRCALWASSHIGWCWLKSPIHMVFSRLMLCCCHSQSCMYVDRCVSELLYFQSLYMFKMHNIPYCPCSSIADMSRCSRCICFHESVKRLVFTSITDLVLSGCC